MKLFKRRLDGFLLPGAPLPMARKILANEPDGARLLLSALNGTDLFVKENGSVRVSTPEEYAAARESNQGDRQC